MIPRFKPSIGSTELRALAAPPADAVDRFERAFAARFGCTEGIAFGYGRTALWALLQALDLEDTEVIVPAYTCSVVAHAVTLSGNTCRFVDADLVDYNMDLGRVAEAISPRTRMIVATHLFGFPLDTVRLGAIVAQAEQRYGQKIWVVQDCAHAFGARREGRLVSAEPDIALFGLNVSKSMTSIFGGMLTTSNRELASRTRVWRDGHLRTPSPLKPILRGAYLVAAAAAFQRDVYAGVRWLQDETPLLSRLTKAYHMDDRICFPPDYAEPMIAAEAAVGLAQLARYDDFERRRQANAAFYAATVRPPHGWDMPPLVEGATYSHFPVRVPDRTTVMQAFLRRGIQVGEVIEYSVPHLSSYAALAGTDYPQSLFCSHHTINLPVHPDLTDDDRQLVVDAVGAMTRSMSGHEAGAAVAGRPS
jgi:dTDP-4-amino-4,6-dideoxygalactose transaminase